MPLVSLEELRVAELDAENRVSCAMLMNALIDGEPKQSATGSFSYPEDANVEIVTAIEYVQKTFLEISKFHTMYGSFQSLLATKTATLLRTANQILTLRQAYNQSSWLEVEAMLSSLNSLIHWIDAAERRKSRSSISFNNDSDLARSAACDAVLDEVRSNHFMLISILFA